MKVRYAGPVTRKKFLSPGVLPVLAVIAVIVIFVTLAGVGWYRSAWQKTVPAGIGRQLRYLSSDRNYRIPVITYHYVENVVDDRDFIRKSLDTLPDIFSEQITTLRDEGFTFLMVSEMSAIIDGRLELPEKPVVLTFDDGYADLYTEVLPVLKANGARATAYLCPGLLDRKNYLSRYQVAQIVRSGLIEIGAHTITHKQLAGQPQETVMEEVSGSRRMLEEAFGVTVTAFAYPYGSFDRQTIAAVMKAGYTSAASTVPGVGISRANRFSFPRIRVGMLTGSELVDFIGSYPGRL